MTYTFDFRRKVLRVREQESVSIRETAKRFHMGSASITRWLSRIEVKPSLSRQRKLAKAALAKDIEHHPGAYQRERAARFGVSPKTIWQALKKRCITPKQTKTHGAPSRKRYTAINSREKPHFSR